MGPGPLRLTLLGGFHVERDGLVIGAEAWQRPSARTLVKLLAVQPGHRPHREEILELLWPNLMPESAIQSFRNALSLARRALASEGGRRGAPHYLVTHGELLVRDPVTVEIDVALF